MRWLSVVFVCIISLQMGVYTELSSSSCSLIRTTTSLVTIVPEISELAMRYYRVSSSPSPSNQQSRQKRSLVNEIQPKDSRGGKGSVLEQMIANAFKDVNYTKVALLMLNNNETMMKIRQNIDGPTIIRALIRDIDYEKLGYSLWYALETEFDLEYFISTIVNITHIDLIYEQLITNGTVSEALIKSIHPDINVQTVQRMFDTFKNFTHQFITIISDTERLDDYLYNTVEQKLLTPLGNIIQKLKNENPTTLDQLVEIILTDVNNIVMEQLTTTSKPISPKKTGKDKIRKKEVTTTTTIVTTAEDTTSDDVQLLFYQCSITIHAFGQTIQSMLKAIEQLYCTTVWE